MSILLPRYEEALKESGIQERQCFINVMNITASVFINDHKSGLYQDYKKWLGELAPFNASPEVYLHNRAGEDNADAHLKRQGLRIAPKHKNHMR